MSFEEFIATVVQDAISDIPDHDHGVQPQPLTAAPVSGTVATSPSPSTFSRAMAWVTFMVERHIEIIEWFEQTHAITDTMYLLSQEPTMIKGEQVTFPLDIRTTAGWLLLVHALERYRTWQIEIPYLMEQVRHRIIKSKTWRRADTRANWECFVNIVCARMAIESKTTGLIFADDSINTVMQELHGHGISKRAIREFKVAWSEVAGDVVMGRKDHHDKGTVYALGSGANLEHIYPCSSQETVDEWLKPYDRAYDTLQIHEQGRAQANREFYRQLDVVEAEVESILTEPQLIVNGKVLTPNGWILKTHEENHESVELPRPDRFVQAGAVGQLDSVEGVPVVR